MERRPVQRLSLFRNDPYPSAFHKTTQYRHPGRRSIRDHLRPQSRETLTDTGESGGGDGFGGDDTMFAESAFVGRSAPMPSALASEVVERFEALPANLQEQIVALLRALAHPQRLGNRLDR